ncbi:flagellar type III secretion system pore protein FliP [Candidatus Sumerlaeota bacterium]|nr:flagellar type III secretion system pore protein FliP [Candidatus Sumerlaeota bacterium]
MRCRALKIFAVVAGLALFSNTATAQVSQPAPAPGQSASQAAQGGGSSSWGLSSLIPGGVQFQIDNNATPQQKLSTGIKIVLLMTVLTIAPSLLIMMTSFVRIVIVLSFITRALGLQSIPPTQVLLGLALFLTLFVMYPTLEQIKTDAVDPYMAEQIDEQMAVKRGLAPIREFMFNQTRKKDLILFVNISKINPPQTRGDVPTYVLIPAFLISELKTAFIIGFVIYVPFLVIDMVVAALLLSMGMMMLPPVIISLPFKIILFVLVDGWYLIVGSLIASFGT